MNETLDDETILKLAWLKKVLIYFSELKNNYRIVLMF